MSIQNAIKNFFAREFAQRTYSQCGEDIIIKHIFSGLRVANPSFIDIGAYHPFHLNNTALFYLEGCRGINIEPNPNNFKLFLTYRKRDINLNLGISDKSGNLDYYGMSVPSLNTFSKKTAKNYEKEGYKILNITKVETDTIENILKKFWNNQFSDLLSIDVEGAELEILESIDFRKSYPKVICVESLSFSTSGKGVKNYQLIKLIEGKGYLLYADTNINSIFVKKNLWLSQ